MRALQQKYFGELKSIGKEAASHSFPYHFYFSRALDLSEKDQIKSDQRAIQFDRYRDQTVVRITGNYFASYSAEFMKPVERARQTYQDVMYPLLQSAVKALANADMPQAFAFEISHHFRKKVLGVSSENVENVVLVIPMDAAKRLVAASEPKAREAAVLEGEAFLNAVPVSLYAQPDVEVAQAEPTQPPQAARIPERLVKNPGGLLLAKPPSIASPVNTPPVNSPAAVNTPAVSAPAAPRDTSPAAIKDLQSSMQPDLDRMVQEINAQAHFVRYAPPALIPFHNGLYLQLSMATMLPRNAAGSQYRLSALAFDQHIAHLIRPVLEHVKSHENLDGIDFSTAVRIEGDSAGDGTVVAVEFIFPLNLLRSYAQFDSTGQQLIDGGFVLINGERVSLNLQIAEAGLPSQ